MCKFDEKDVETLAKAVVDPENHMVWESDYNNPRWEGYYCHFCHGEGKDGRKLLKCEPDKIVHKLDCPVLIARDLAT